MIAILSPAKTLDFEHDPQWSAGSAPPLQDYAQQVMAALKPYSPEQLQELQSISEQLAQLNYERNQGWGANLREAPYLQPALYAFQGDVYQGLQVEEWEPADRDYAREHLLILSGLYGVLRPQDLIQPYRLEMGTSLPVRRARHLYDFWAGPLHDYLTQQLDAREWVINLASNEYFKAWEKADPPNPVLQVQFKDQAAKGQYRTVAHYAKIARGKMARYIIQHRLQKPEELQDYQVDQYYWDAVSSSPDNYVFLRDRS